MAVLQDPVLLVEDLPEARSVHGVDLLAERGVSFGFFGKSLLFKGARCTSMGFWRHGSETSGEFGILLRYDISELQETCRGAEMWLQKLRNRIGVFHYVG